jgi:hypothetical protein
MWPTREIRTEVDYPFQGRRVASLVLVGGDEVLFLKSHPGRVQGVVVAGTARTMIRQEIELKGPFPLTKRRADGSLSEVTDASGQIHYVEAVLKEEPGKLVIRERHSEVRPVSIPLSEVRLITYRKTNVVLTLMAVAAGGAAGLMALAAYSLSHE